MKSNLSILNPHFCVVFISFVGPKRKTSVITSFASRLFTTATTGGIKTLPITLIFRSGWGLKCFLWNVKWSLKSYILFLKCSHVKKKPTRFYDYQKMYSISFHKKLSHFDVENIMDDIKEVLQHVCFKSFHVLVWLKCICLFNICFFINSNL